MTTSPELLAAAAVAAESLMLAFAASLDTQDRDAVNRLLRNGMRLGLLYVPNGPNADPLVRMVLLDAAGAAAPLADLAFSHDTLQ